MYDTDALKRLIRQAFADVSYPGDEHLVSQASFGDEDYLTKEAFRGRDDWQTLEWTFLDDAPDGWASALSFFTPAAFRFYLPAYLLADLEKALLRAKPYLSLCFGLADADRAKPTSRKTRQQARLRRGYTKFDARSQRFADFTPSQAAAVVAYLQHTLQDTSIPESTRQTITQALHSYWLNRTEPSSG